VACGLTRLERSSYSARSMVLAKQNKKKRRGMEGRGSEESNGGNKRTRTRVPHHSAERRWGILHSYVLSARQQVPMFEDGTDFLTTSCSEMNKEKKKKLKTLSFWGPDF